MTYNITTAIMWVISVLVILLVVGILVWVAKQGVSILKNKKRHDAIEKEANAEIAAKMNLPIEDAWKSAQIVIRERAQCEEWDKAPSEAVMTIMNRLDPSVRNLFGKYKRLLFRDNGTLISAECLLEATPTAEEYTVGRNERMDDILTIRIDGPDIYEKHGGKIRAVYPSLIHYIAFIEDDTYWG